MIVSTTPARNRGGTFFRSEWDMTVVSRQKLETRSYSNSKEITPLPTMSRVVFLRPRERMPLSGQFLRTCLESRQKKLCNRHLGSNKGVPVTHSWRPNGTQLCYYSKAADGYKVIGPLHASCNIFLLGMCSVLNTVDIVYSRITPG